MRTTLQTNKLAHASLGKKTRTTHKQTTKWTTEHDGNNNNNTIHSNNIARNFKHYFGTAGDFSADSWSASLPSCTRPVNGCGVVPCCNYVSFVFSSGLIRLLLKSALSIWGGILKHNCAMAGDFVVDSVSASFSAVYTVRERWRGCSALYLGLSGIFLRFVSIYLPVSVPMVIRFRTSVGFKWPQPSVCRCPDRQAIDVHRPIHR